MRSSRESFLREISLHCQPWRWAGAGFLTKNPFCALHCCVWRTGEKNEKQINRSLPALLNNLGEEYMCLESARDHKLFMHAKGMGNEGTIRKVGYELGSTWLKWVKEGWLWIAIESRRLPERGSERGSKARERSRQLREAGSTGEETLRAVTTWLRTLTLTQ